MNNSLSYTVNGNGFVKISIGINISAVKLKGQYGESFDWDTDIERQGGKITVPLISNLSDFFNNRSLSVRV